VSYADLDLRERSAQRALVLRVIRASEKLCIRTEGKFNVDKYLGGWENSCAARTYQHAQSQIDDAIHIAQSENQRAGTLAIVLDQNTAH